MLHEGDQQKSDYICKVTVCKYPYKQNRRKRRRRLFRRFCCVQESGADTFADFSMEELKIAGLYVKIEKSMVRDEAEKKRR